MTLQEIVQIIGGIGVIASLIYVAIQIRNNARAVRAAAYQQLSVSMSGPWDALFLNGEACSLVLRGCDDFAVLDRVEKARFRFMVMAFMRRFENAWFQHKIGTLKEGDWQAISADLDSLYSLPGARAAWQLVKNRSNPNFRSYVDMIVQRSTAADVAAQPSELRPATVSS
jgi:hypothetical protein